MERKISFEELEKAVDNAYEQNKSCKEGDVNPRVKNLEKDSDFGIAVVLTDGRVVKKADADTRFALGDIARTVVATVLMQQNTPDEVVKKSGTEPKEKHNPDDHKVKLHINKHALRATSAIEPTGDLDGKYNLMVNTLIDLTGAQPDFCDKLYETLTSEAKEYDIVNRLAERQYTLYDDPSLTIDVYNRLRSLCLSSVEIATLGATIAADGINPKTNTIVFDGSKASSIVTLITTVGNKRRGRANLMEVGLPVVHSFGGGVMAILPGFGAIVAYSPRIDKDCKASARGYKAVKSIANSLGLNIFASARVTVE